MKKTFILFLSLSTLLFLTACNFSAGGSEQEKITKSFLDELVKNHDGDAASEYLSKEIKEFLNLGTGIIAGSSANNDFEGYKRFEKNLKEISKKTKYTVEDSEIKGQVKVNIEYADLSEPMTEALTEAFEKLFAEAFSGKQTSEEETEKLMYEVLNSKLENYTPEIKKVESTVKLKEENGKLVITEIGKDLIEALSYGFNPNLGED